AARCHTIQVSLHNRYKSEHLHLSLPDALPISCRAPSCRRTRSCLATIRPECSPPTRPPPRSTGTSASCRDSAAAGCPRRVGGEQDRKSTRLNSSHLGISYAVFCLKKKRTAPLN